MPRGERQTTGTAQTLLGAKQIAAQERASKRSTVADYVKTGVGALKSVGDYLQQKQSLEQNQEALNLKQSLFSAQYGDVGEQEQRRQEEQRLRLAQAESATAQAKWAGAQQEALAGRLAGEAAQAEAAGDVAPEVEAQKLAEGELRKEGMTIANRVANIRAEFAEGFAQGELDLVKTQKDKLLQDIESSKAQTTDAAEGRRLDGLRLDLERDYREALMADMKEKGLLSKRQMKIFEKRYQDETDPVRRVAMMTEFEKRVAESTAKKAELDVKFAEGTLENKISMSVLDLKGREHEVGSAGEKRKILKITRQFAKLREKGEVDRLVKVTESLDQQIKASISGEERDDRRLVLEGRRLVVEEERGQALIQKMKEEGILAGKQFDLLKEKWEKTSDPEKREAMLSDFDKRLREVQLETEKAKGPQIKAAAALTGLQTELAQGEVDKQKKQKELGFTDAEWAANEANIASLDHLAEEYPTLTEEAREAQKDLRAGKGKTSVPVQFVRNFAQIFRDENSETGEKLIRPDELTASSLDALAAEEAIGGGVLSGTLRGTRLIAKLGTLWHNTPEKLRPELAKWLKKTWPQGPAKLRGLAEERSGVWVNPMRNWGALTRMIPGLGAQIEWEWNWERRFLTGLASGMDDPTWRKRGVSTMNFPDNVQTHLDMTPPSLRERVIKQE